MMDSPAQPGGLEPITSKVLKLDQLLQGKSVRGTNAFQITREGLVDALLVLYEECTSEGFKKNQYISKFIKKYASTISELKRLRISINDFEVKKVIGRGHFGEVEVVREKSSGDVYALKVLHKTDMLSQQNVAFYEEERDIMAKTDSPWITQLHYAFQDQNNLYLVMDFHPGGDLLSLLSRYDDQFEEAMARFYLAEIVQAIHALHTMGYVHRDIKPENILLDRTGHVKLADFGSACRIKDAKSSVCNMPVGTPDYISPEILEKMNSNGTTSQFGEECDWWSLGICMYEMLFGKTPFTDVGGSMVTTYANIMNYQKALKIPEDGEVSDSACSLIKSLLTGPSKRLTYEKIFNHSFFAEINFDSIRQTVPPFIPNTSRSDDTSNFEEFDKTKPRPNRVDLKDKSGFSGRDLPFIGFTYTKGLNGNDRSHASQEISKSSSKSLLERRLSAKTKELQEYREKYNEIEQKKSMMEAELESLKSRLAEKEICARNAEAERDALERNIAKYIAENKSLKRSLNQENEQCSDMNAKIMALVEQIKQQAEVAKEMKEDALSEELDNCKVIIEDLEEEKAEVEKQLAALRLELKKEKSQSKLREQVIADLENQIQKYKKNSRASTKEITAMLDEKTAEYKAKEAEMALKLNQAVREKKEAVKLLNEAEEAKNHLEEELFQVRVAKDTQDVLKRRLSVSEERRKSLESHMFKVAMLEKQEAELRDTIREKDQEIQELKERTMELEEKVRNLQREYSTREKIYKKRESQLQIKIKELEDELRRLRSEKGNIEEQSLLVFEENEERFRTIQEQESTIALLKGNLKLLEDQISAMKAELEAENSCSPRRKSRRSHFRSGSVQTDVQRLVSDSVQTSFCLNDISEEDVDSDARRDKHVVMETQTESYGMQGETNSCSMQTESSYVDASSSCRGFRGKIQTEMRLFPANDESVGDTTSSSGDPCGDDFKVTVRVQQRRSRSKEKYQQSTSYVAKKSPKKPDSPEKRYHSYQDQDTDSEDSTQEIDEEEEERIRQAEEEGKPIDSSKMKKNIKTWRQLRRHLEKELSDTKQEKLFLELKLESLQKEAETFKDSTHQQRLRALDLKYELRKKTTEYELETSELKEKLAKAELALTEAKEQAANLKESEHNIKTRLNKLQQEYDSHKKSCEKQISELQDAKMRLEAKVQSLEKKYKLAEESERQARDNAEKYEKESREYKLKVSELSPKCVDLEMKLRFALEEKTKFKIEAEGYKDTVAEKTRRCDQLEQGVKQLQLVCRELEEQIEDYETLLKKSEEKEVEWTKEKCAYENSVEEKDREIRQLQKHLHNEKQNRNCAEEAQKKNKLLQETAEKAFKAEIEHLKKQTSSQKICIDSLNHQLNELEHQLSLLEVDNKNKTRKVEVLDAENIALKEEISKHITHIAELKGSNFKLSKKLEEAMERYELLSNHRTDLENEIENIQACHNHEKYRLESTLAQQIKLIEYLQHRVENPPKKKKGLFGKKEQSSGSIQFREMQHSLDNERGRNAALREEILKLKDDLHQAKTETIRLKSRSTENVSQSGDANTVVHSSAVSMLTLSPSVQATPITNRLYPSLDNLTESKQKPEEFCDESKKPQSERMHHNIPHRFVTGLNSRATKCAVCLGSVHFVKQACKCQECNIVCHPKCVSELPASCGLPTEYARHFTDMMTKACRSTNSGTKVSVAGLKFEMEGWMKMPKSGKQVWEKRWVKLSDNILHIYTSNNTDTEPVDEFDLCPSNGEVTIHSAVTAADLTKTASVDLPYILRLEFEPYTTCWPGRSIYLMAPTFVDKQKWVATLEAIVNHSGKEERSQDVKVLGKPAYKAKGSNRLDVNCSLPLSEQLILLGADEGLFVMELANSPDSRPLTKLSGVASVHILEDVPGIGLIVLVVGKEREVMLLEKHSVEQCLARSSSTGLHKVSLHPKRIPGAVSCTTLAVSTQSDGIYMCVATAEKVLLYKYSNRNEEFVLKKDLATTEACSCMTFAKDFAIIGTDRFYSINLYDYSFSEFLDKTDTTLAFAVFSAAHYESFPIAVLKVSPPDELEEFLLCFSEFGVFVSSYGRRTRKQDMKWSGLPLSFAYRAPYLYVVYFNTLQVVEIRPVDSVDMNGGRKFLNIINPRYLGPAVTPSAVYIASLKEKDTEIICFKGTMGSNEWLEDKENKYPDEKSQTETSPLKIRTMSTSPGGSIQRQCHRPSYRDSDESSDTSIFDQTKDTTTPKGYTKSSAYKDRSHHPTVMTLDRVLKEQSILRAEARADHSANRTARSVHGLRNMFEKEMSKGLDFDEPDESD